MSRVFTTLFKYKRKLYMAVISHIGTSVHIYVPDENLHSIIPNGKFTYDVQEGPRMDTLRFTQTRRLVLRIISSIDLQQEGLKVHEEIER
jgi:hypothetical protein